MIDFASSARQFRLRIKAKPIFRWAGTAWRLYPVLLMAVMTLGMQTVVPPPEIFAAEDRESEVALEYYITLAENGSPDAQLVLGDFYRYGEGVPVDLLKAYAWYYIAAQQGVEEAIKPMNEVFRSLPKAQWPKAKIMAEALEKRILSQ